MRLLVRVVRTLEAVGISHALIGAAALSVHGVSRATLDRDLLAVDDRALEPATWRELEDAGVEVEIRRGDATDPLAGVVRFSSAELRPVDLILGRAVWQQAAIERARTQLYSGIELPVLEAADLVLLKLYAGGPQDAWDVSQLLTGERSERLMAEVEQHLAALPSAAQELWRRLLTERQSG